MFKLFASEIIVSLQILMIIFISHGSERLVDACAWLCVMINKIYCHNLH